MKRVLAIVLALLIVASAVSITVLARGDHSIRFEFKDRFHHEKGETPTDIPDDKGHHNHKPQRPESDTDVATDTDVDTDTDADDVCDSIYDAVIQLKKHGHHGKDFRIPMNDEIFKLIEMLIEDGKVYFGFRERDDQTGEMQQIAMDNLTDVPQEMKFIVLGDNDADGAITAVDALAILKHVVNKAPMEHEGRRILSDMDEDEAVTANDALQVLKTVVGKR